MIHEAPLPFDSESRGVRVEAAPLPPAEAVVAGTLRLYRAVARARAHAEDLNRVDEGVVADLTAGRLTSTTMQHLRRAGVPLGRALDAIQKEIQAGKWDPNKTTASRDHRGAAITALAELARAWQAAVGRANDAVPARRQELREGMDVLAAQAQAQSSGSGRLPKEAEPQSRWIGGELADHGVKDQSPLRRLLDLEVLSGLWVPRVDKGETSIAILPEDLDASYRHACRAVQGIALDQMSRAAPGALALVWIDTLGHGESAGPLLQLADLARHLIDGRVWHSGSDVEAALLRVSQRMASRQKRHYSPLLGQNGEVGQPEAPSEPRILVVATGYPDGLSEASARLLERICAGGGQLGVSVLIVMHPRMASIAELVDSDAPGLARFTEGPGPRGAPPWWTGERLPPVNYVLSRARQLHAAVYLPEETIWVPVRFRQPEPSDAEAIVRGYAAASKPAAQERIPALRSAMIAWLFKLENATGGPDSWEGFATSDATRPDGGAYSLAEVAQQASYLHEQGYITAVQVAEFPDGSLRPRLTARGQDLALAGGRSLDDFIRHGTERMIHMTTEHNTYNAPVFQGDANNAQLVWNSSQVNQQRTEIRHVAPGFETLAEVVADVVARLPELGMTGDDLTDARISGQEILDEVVSETPDLGRLRRGVAALKGFLLPIATRTAVGAGEGGHELAKAAVARLQDAIL